MIAKIAVAAANFAFDKPYSYRVPDHVRLEPGMRVRVPFGRGNTPTEGIVLELTGGSEAKLKPIAECLDGEALISPTMLRLAAFIRERYFCTFYEAARAMLPAGLWFRANNTYSLTQDRSWEMGSFRQPDAKKLLLLLQEVGGSAQEKALRQAVEDPDAFDKAVSYLLRKKWLSCNCAFTRRAADKTEKVATLAASADEAMTYADSRPRSAAGQAAVLRTMCAIGSVSVKELCYFTGAAPATVKRLAELGFLTLSEKPVLRCSQIKPATLTGPLTLNTEQQTAFQGLCAQLQEQKPGVALLHGVTGSGKTSVYLKLIRQCLEGERSAILMVPEIALTPQLLSLLAAHFGQAVAVLHSSLSVAERYDQWKRVRSGEAKVVVGTRSAVFAPCQNLGLVILDEEQEHSYRSENNPRYCAREVAFWRGWKENALVLLGSATPSVESMYHARKGDYRLYTLTQRYNGRPLPAVQIVDMREEVKNGNDGIISHGLLAAMEQNWKAGKQTVLFLNRRGNSRALLCVDCGQAPECPRCSARLTYHSANERMMCHYCGFSQNVPSRCPSCGSAMKRLGSGTQRLQQELLELYPDMEVARMDADTVSATNTHEQLLDRFQQNNTPVLIGTQMVAKGLNLPNVTLVGVLDADLGLYTGSYRAAETTFNMLTQVVGRAGRGEDPGRALIQTLCPEHKVINLAARQDYAGFYELEIALRRLQGLPPFGDLVSITLTGLDEAAILRGAVKLRDSIAACLPDITVLGPAPCPVPKINYNFRYCITLRCQLDNQKRATLAHLLRQFAKDSANRGVSAFLDVNGSE